MPEQWWMTPMTILISHGEAKPTGTAATMSKSGNGQPRQAIWKALDDDYEVTLPANVFAPPNQPPPPSPPPPGSTVRFKVTKGNESGTYTLWQNAPSGQQDYSIGPDDSETGPPSVIVDP